MPLDLVHVHDVGRWATAKPGICGYTITAITVEDRPRTIQVQTVSDWKASLCEQEKALKCGIWIGSKDSRYGLDIVTVKLDDTKWSPDGEA